MASAISFGNANSGFQTGTINGPVNIEFRPPERAETPPNPSAVIPFSRDSDFVERGEVFKHINQKCAALGSRTALVGLGGVGKSQLAIEYAYRTRDRSPKTWIFWVHASNADRFEQSFREIANCAKIPERRDPKANIFQLVHDWLRDDKNGEWFLILDNVDDASFLVEAQSTRQEGQTKESGSSRPLKSYLPQCPSGSILVTTRSKNAALKLVEQRDIVAIDPMSSTDAVALFEKKLGVYNTGNDAAELAVALEYMPLAIVQASAYITQRAPRYSIREYLQDFWKSDRNKMSLLDFEGGELRRDREAKNSIIITWQISFNRIREIRPTAADLLSLMSFFDRQGIPEVLLRSRGEQRSLQQEQQEESSNNNHTTKDAGHSDSDEDNLSQPSVNNGFEEDILALRNYSFISINADYITFKMHGLVQLATRKWLKAEKQEERWKQKFIRNLDVEFPTGEYENWETCRALFPHVQSAVAQKPKEENSLKDWASILYKAAWYTWRMGNGVEAEKLSNQSMKVRKRIFGQEHNNTLNSIDMLGLAYKLRGRWDAAEELQAQVMETRKKKLGVDHPDTLTSMANLASTYRNQGRWDAAEELEVQVIETRKKKLGMDHLDTLTSMANLATTYRNQGRWDAAEELEVQVIETRKKKLGVDHPDTLTTMTNLASTYRNQGRWDAAEELEVQVIETSKKKLGVDHPNTLVTMANLASTYMNQGRWDAAEELQVQVIETSKKKLGVDHPNTLTSMNNLAFTWKGTGRNAEAIRLMEECLQSGKRVFGLNHPNIISSCTILASWKAEQEDIVLI